MNSSTNACFLISNNVHYHGSFNIKYKPGKENSFSDATSRFPTRADDECDVAVITIAEVFCGIMVAEPEEAELGTYLSALSQDDSRQVRAITWDLVREVTKNDQHMQNLIALINLTFPQEKNEMPEDLLQYWSLRNNLYVIDGIVLMRDQLLIPPTLRNKAVQTYVPGSIIKVVIPPALREEVVHSLHSAHQGVSSMNERAKVGVYRPGITTDIQNMRNSCQSCNNIMPSQTRTPIEPLIPTTPFEAIACDYFNHMGHYYFVATDRLSGWIELQQIKIGTNEAGAQGQPYVQP